MWVKTQGQLNNQDMDTQLVHKTTIFSIYADITLPRENNNYLGWIILSSFTLVSASGLAYLTLAMGKL